MFITSENITQVNILLSHIEDTIDSYTLFQTDIRTRHNGNINFYLLKKVQNAFQKTISLNLLLFPEKFPYLYDPRKVTLLTNDIGPNCGNRFVKENSLLEEFLPVLSDLINFKNSLLTQKIKFEERDFDSLLIKAAPKQIKDVAKKIVSFENSLVLIDQRIARLEEAVQSSIGLCR